MTPHICNGSPPFPHNNGQPQLGFILFILHYPVFQPVIHEPLSKPDHLVQQNGVNGDLQVNRGTSHEAPVQTKESQGTGISYYSKQSLKYHIVRDVKFTYYIQGCK